ncbi:MAG: hypothetical protein AAB587_02070 [Patescibacteria group bacterium]
MKKYIAFTSAFFPLSAFAISSIQEFLILGLIQLNNLIYVAFAAALLTFIWGLARFILHIGGDKSLEEGKRLMGWGVITLFIISSIWGIVGFLQQSLFGVGWFSFSLFGTI